MRQLLAHPAAGHGADRQPGAAYIESVFPKCFGSQRIPTEPTALDGRSDYIATLAEDRGLRDTLAGGATAAKATKKPAKARSRKATRLSEARRAALGAYLGDRIVR